MEDLITEKHLSKLFKKESLKYVLYKSVWSAHQNSYCVNVLVSELKSNFSIVKYTAENEVSFEVCVWYIIL